MWIFWEAIKQLLLKWTRGGRTETCLGFFFIPIPYSRAVRTTPIVFCVIFFKYFWFEVKEDWWMHSLTFIQFHLPSLETKRLPKPSKLYFPTWHVENYAFPGTFICLYSVTRVRANWWKKRWAQHVFRVTVLWRTEKSLSEDVYCVTGTEIINLKASSGTGQLVLTSWQSWRWEKGFG